MIGIANIAVTVGRSNGELPLIEKYTMINMTQSAKMIANNTELSICFAIPFATKLLVALMFISMCSCLQSKVARHLHLLVVRAIHCVW